MSRNAGPRESRELTRGLGLANAFSQAIAYMNPPYRPNTLNLNPGIPAVSRMRGSIETGEPAHGEGCGRALGDLAPNAPHRPETVGTGKTCSFLPPRARVDRLLRLEAQNLGWPEGPQACRQRTLQTSQTPPPGGSYPRLDQASKRRPHADVGAGCGLPQASVRCRAP